MQAASEAVSRVRQFATRLFGLRGHAVVHNTLWLSLVQFSGYLLPMVTLPYLSRVLSVEKFGSIAYAQSFVWNFTVLTEYGFNITATREVAVNRGKPAELSRIFSSVLAAKGILMLAGLAILLGIVRIVPRFRPDLQMFLASFVSVIGYWLFPTWLFQGLELMKHVAVRDFLSKAASLILLFGLVHGDRDYIWAAGAPAAGLALAGLVGLIAVPFLTPVRPKWPRWTDVWDKLKTGWPPFLTNAASSLSYSTNVVLLGSLGYAAQIGLFNASFRICSLPRGFIAPLATSLYSHLSHRGRSEEETIAFVRRNAKLLSLPFLAMSLAMMIVGPFIIPWVLGRKYGAAIPAFEVLAFGVFVLALSHVYSTYYMLPCGYDKAWARIILISLALNMLLLWALLPLMPASVALAVTLTAIDLTATIGYWRFFRRRSRELLPAVSN